MGDMADWSIEQGDLEWEDDGEKEEEMACDCPLDRRGCQLHKPKCPYYGVKVLNRLHFDRTMECNQLQQENAALKTKVAELQANGLELSIQIGEAIAKQEKAEADLANAVKPIVPLKYCKEHKTICSPWNDKMACCLEANLNRLVEAVNEAMDGTLPYLAEKRLKEALDEIKER